MKCKYLVFLYEDYYPMGGLEDFISGASHLVEVSGMVKRAAARRFDTRWKSDNLNAHQLACTVYCAETGEFFRLLDLDGDFKPAGNTVDGFKDYQPSDEDKKTKTWTFPARTDRLTHAWNAETGEQVPIGEADFAASSHWISDIPFPKVQALPEEE